MSSAPFITTNRNTGHFDPEVTAADPSSAVTPPSCAFLGVGRKLVGVQDLGDREHYRTNAFAVDEPEPAARITARAT